MRRSGLAQALPTPETDARAAPASPRAEPPTGNAAAERWILEARDVYKIFADDPSDALALLQQNRTKDEVFAETGAVVGVQDASFDVRPGEVFVIMGLSGSGKSTLVRLLNRLIEPTSGTILLGGQDLTRMSKRELIAVRRREMSFVFQSFALMPHLNVIDNAAFGLTMAGVPRAKRHAAAEAALEQVGLAAYARSYPHELSGGMQQRVGLARALAKNPSIMFMDEAFSALDPLIRTEMQDELMRLQREQQRTIVFISHDLDEAMRIGDRIAIMEGGRIVQVGTPHEILLDPRDDYVRSFFRNVDVSKVLRAGDVVQPEPPAVLNLADEARKALQTLHGRTAAFGYVVDESGRFTGVVSRLSLEQVARRPGAAVQDSHMAAVQPAPASAYLRDILDIVADTEWPVPIIDDNGGLRGVISRAHLLRTLHRTD